MTVAWEGIPWHGLLKPPRMFLDKEERRKDMKWSGCNYYINQGNNEHEPIGTAQSMHDCGSCKLVPICPLAKDTETWPHSEAHDKLSSTWVREQRAKGSKV